jgi:ribosomal 30S subunit maturation factor RimM
MVGTVVRVEGSMERSYAVVEGREGEVLIPLDAGFCVRVDPQEKTIVVDPPEGLIELNQ